MRPPFRLRPDASRVPRGPPRARQYFGGAAGGDSISPGAPRPMPDASGVPHADARRRHNGRRTGAQRVSRAAPASGGKRAGRLPCAAGLRTRRARTLRPGRIPRGGPPIPRGGPPGPPRRNSMRGGPGGPPRGLPAPASGLGFRLPASGLGFWLGLPASASGFAEGGGFSRLRGAVLAQGLWPWAQGPPHPDPQPASAGFEHRRAGRLPPLRG